MCRMIVSKLEIDSRRETFVVFAIALDVLSFDPFF